MIRNAIYDVDTFGSDADYISVESVNIKVETYQNGNLIDSYETNCDVFDKFENTYSITAEVRKSVYQKCFDLDVH